MTATTTKSIEHSEQSDSYKIKKKKRGLHMKSLFQRFKAKHEGGKNKKGKAALSVLGGTTALAALAPAAGAAPIEFTGQSLNVDVADVVSTGFNFANLFNEYTLLVLGIMLAPVLIGFIIWLWGRLPKKGKASA